MDIRGKGLSVLGEPDPNGSVNAVGDNALVEGQRQRSGLASDHHLAGCGCFGGRVECRRAECELCACSNGSLVGNGERWVGRRKTQSSCGITSSDKGSSDGEDVRGCQCDIKALWDRSRATDNVEECLMAGFDGKNSRSSCQKVLVVDDIRASEVSCDTDVLDNTSDRGHCSHVGEHRLKVERAAG